MNDPAVRRQPKPDPLTVAYTQAGISISRADGRPLSSEDIAQAAARLIRFRLELIAAEATK